MMPWTIPSKLMEGCPSPVEINVGSPVNAIAFSTIGDYLVGASNDGVEMWRAEDGNSMVKLTGETRLNFVQCLSVSPNGRLIAAGTSSGNVSVWDAKTYETVFVHKEGVSDITGVDFSPNSSRLVVASMNNTVSVWDIATHERVVGPLRHERMVIAAKYSPQGDRIATATHDRSSVQVYDSNDGRLLLDIPVKVTSWYNAGLLWRSSENLLAVCGSTIKDIEIHMGSAACEWLTPDNNRFSSLVMSQRGEFLAYSAHRTVTFWDVTTHNLLAFIQHPHDIHAIALSADDRHLAIGGTDRKITIEYLRDVLPPSYFTPPFIDIPNAALDSWKRDQLANAEALLTKTITDYDYRALANRALLRSHLRHWDAAINDARKSIEIRPSAIGYIAQSVALIGGGQKLEGLLVYDFAFRHSHVSGADLLLLIKAVVLFLAGEHDDAMSRMDALVATVHLNSTFDLVQERAYAAYMYLLLGNLRMNDDDYERAIQFFEHAQAKLRDQHSSVLLAVSLISGWKFEGIDTTIQQRLCEAMYAAGRTKEAGRVVLELVNTYEKAASMSEATINWISDFAQRCLSASENDGNNPSLLTSSLLMEWAKAKLTGTSWKDALASAVDFHVPRFTIYCVVCEHLETADLVIDAAECFHQMTHELGAVSHSERDRWANGFKHRCCGKLEKMGDAAAAVRQHDKAISHYSSALSLEPANKQDILVKRSKASIANGLWKDALDDANLVIRTAQSSPWCYERILAEWTKADLTGGLWKGVLSGTGDLKIPRIMVYRALCEGLERVGGLTDAIDCYHQMVGELADPEETTVQGEQEKWFRDFRNRCSGKLENLGDKAVDNKQPDEAIRHYSAALSIHPANTQRLFIIRSKVSMAKGSLEDAIDEAGQAVALDPSSPWGYEVKRVALHQAGRYDDAIQTFESMLSKMAHSADLQIRERHDQYIDPSTIRALIRKTVQRTIRHLPRVLINTTTGRLQDKAGQTATFMSLPIVSELISSMTTRIDRARIKREVKQFFRYVMLSHRWEENEPLFHDVIYTAVYNLDQSSTHDKLQTFCKIVRDAGFNWAWSDTCCIDKRDHFVLQEALVAMFRWYRGSAMVFVFLRGVRSPAKRGDLTNNVWNTRGWTLQEYVAAKVIRFYTEDWKLYLESDLGLFNHKESPEIISEMEKATRVSAQLLMSLRPGLTSIREKLRLASTRETTLVEDAAYSLLGIFSVSGVPAIYGEGEKALGRLLSHILAGSGDTGILAWTGQSGGFNSCLPARITVFNRPTASHLPSHIEDAKMDEIVTALGRSALDHNLALTLYDRLNALPTPWFAASRMRLPCIAIKLPTLSLSRTSSNRIYRAETRVFGTVEIKTRQDLSRFTTLYLAHPWLDTLLDREHTSGSLAEGDVAEPSSPNWDEDMSDEDVEDDDTAGPRFPGADDEDPSEEENEDSSSLPEPELRPPTVVARADAVPVDMETRVLRLVARLGQPFGALLFALTSTGRRALAYRRVATDSMITVQIREDIPLGDLVDNVRTLDVL